MKPTRSLWPLLFLLAAVLSLSACQLFGSDEVTDSEPVVAAPEQTGSYYNFDDVQIPFGMKPDRKATYIYENEELKAGVLTLKGAVDLNEALTFFETKLPEDGWTMLSSFTAHKNVRIFTKPEKVCLIIAQRAGSLSDQVVEIWVAPVRPGVKVPLSGALSDMAPAEKPMAGPKIETEAGPAAQPPREEPIMENSIGDTGDPVKGDL